MIDPSKTTSPRRTDPRAGYLTLALVLAVVLAVVLALGLAVLPGGQMSAAVAAQEKGKVDCSKYTGTEKEACEKMMARRRS